MWSNPSGNHLVIYRVIYRVSEESLSPTAAGGGGRGVAGFRRTAVDLRPHSGRLRGPVPARGGVGPGKQPVERQRNPGPDGRRLCHSHRARAARGGGGLGGRLRGGFETVNAHVTRRTKRTRRAARKRREASRNSRELRRTVRKRERTTFHTEWAAREAYDLSHCIDQRALVLFTLTSRLNHFRIRLYPRTLSPCIPERVYTVLERVDGLAVHI